MSRFRVVHIKVVMMSEVVKLFLIGHAYNQPYLNQEHAPAWITSCGDYVVHMQPLEE